MDQTFTIIEDASIKERLEAAGFTKDKMEGAIEIWAEENYKRINKKKGIVLLNKIFGVKAEAVKPENMISFYRKYFQGGNGKESVKLFVRDVVAYYTSDNRTDVDGLKRDLNTIQSLAGAFGSTTSEVIAQLVDAEIQFMKNILSNSDRLSQEINNILPGDDNERLLQFLIKGEHLDAPKPIPTTEPPKTEPPTTEGLEKNKTYTLEDLFRKVKGPVDPNHKYFIPDPLDSIPLTDEQIQELGITKPFMRYESDFDANISLVVNSEVAPFFHDLKTGGDHQNKRFEEALGLTNGESLLFGLAAGSSTTIENQAKLFKNFSQAIVKIHQDSFKKQGDDNLLLRWTNGQTKKKPHEFNSLYHFTNDDSNRPENEKLLVDPTIWPSRLTELSDALANNKLLPHHLRWIEFLSHSVDVTKLIEMNQAKSTIEDGAEQVELKGPELYKGYLGALAKYREADDAAYKYFWSNQLKRDGRELEDPVYGPLARKEMLARQAFEKLADTLEDEILPNLLGIEPISRNASESNLPFFLLKRQVIAYTVQISDPKNEKYREEFNKGIQTKLNELIEYMRKKTGQKVNYEKAEELMAAHDELIKKNIIPANQVL